ncbi:hypothetical protein KCP70_07305 [Salmonella enterica subsp. enterica]|nr:hypothetical protein KCP70_07305 [Salmonella enterica subsp. enterica]
MSTIPLLVNGAQSYVEVSRGWVRLRLLNASNSRRCRLGSGRARMCSRAIRASTCAGFRQTVVTGGDDVEIWLI